jgi:fermentation-respiration switch protein FrsA (DUF1100 family)
MKIAKVLAYIIIILYFLVLFALFLFQTRLIFHPGKLVRDFKFKLNIDDEEIFLKTSDGEEINALFYQGQRDEVILYFHGNAGDLSGWHFAAEDFVAQGFSVLIIDYRGYGKSSGKISEDGFYIDAETAYNFLLNTKAYTPQDIIIYGRSIGTGVAVDLAVKHKTKGLVLESAYTSLPALANEKLPMLFPSLYIRYNFDNLKKIESLESPVILIHGTLDTLIPFTHTKKLAAKIRGKKKVILIDGGAHNDLNSFPLFQEFLETDLKDFFSPLKISE